MTAQIIEREGKPEYAVLPFEEYLQLLELAEDAQDLADAREAERALARGEDEAIPADIARRLIAGEEHPLRSGGSIVASRRKRLAITRAWVSLHKPD